MTDNKPECSACGETYPDKRRQLGYRTCLTCGEQAAVEQRMGWTVSLAGHKQGYTLITRKEQLKEINKYAQT